MSILTVVKDVCMAVGVNPPTSMFASSVQPRTQAEMLALANEMVLRITSDNRDWTKLKSIAMFAGDGVKTAFDMPADYRRMPATANVWRGPTPMRFIPDTDEWLQRRINNWTSNPSSGEWTLIGGQMHIYPPLAAAVTQPGTPVPLPPLWATAHDYIIDDLAYDNTDGTHWKVLINHTSGATTFADDRTANPTYWVQVAPPPTPPPVVITPAEIVQFVYISRNCVALASGGFGETFMSDSDQFAIDERLLKLAMIWQWKANKGSPYAEDMGTYSDALVIAMGSDSPAPIILDAPPRTVEGWHANVW